MNIKKVTHWIFMLSRLFLPGAEAIQSLQSTYDIEPDGCSVSYFRELRCIFGTKWTPPWCQRLQKFVIVREFNFSAQSYKKSSHHWIRSHVNMTTRIESNTLGLGIPISKQNSKIHIFMGLYAQSWLEIKNYVVYMYLYEKTKW